LIALEKRLFYLETVLGSSSNVMDVESAASAGGALGISSSSGTPLVETLARLERRVALLDTVTLDAIRVKAGTLKTDLEAAAKANRGGSTSDARILEAAQRLDELNTKAQRIDSIASDIPALVLRLKTLEAVHSAAATFTQRLQEMEAGVKALGDDLRTNGEALTLMRSGLKDNLDVMQRNIEKVDARIASLPR